MMRSWAISRLWCALSLAPILFAAPGGRIRGTVHDAAGGIVAQAIVTVSNAATGERRTAHPHPDGIFEFPEIAPGAWNVSVDAHGFKRVSIPDLAVQVDRTSTVAVRLEVG